MVFVSEGTLSLFACIIFMRKKWKEGGREGRKGGEEGKGKVKEEKQEKKRRKSGGAQPAKQVKGTHKIFFFFAEATEKILRGSPLTC